MRVFGGDLARQVRAGVTESIYGTLYDCVDVDTEPRLSEDEARTKFASMSSGEFPGDRPVELVVLPMDIGGFALTWRSHVWTKSGWMHTFIDAHSGQIVLQYHDLHHQAAVGVGTGMLGDRKKVSSTPRAQVGS